MPDESQTTPRSLPLESSTLVQITFWGPVRLRFDREGLTADIDFERAQCTQPGNPGPHVIDSSRDPGTLVHLVSLWQHAVRAALITADSALVIHFERGATLEISPQDEFEAWQYADTAGLHVLSLPGGGITSWLNCS